mgnify:CR=1 FL=1
MYLNESMPLIFTCSIITHSVFNRGGIILLKISIDEYLKNQDILLAHRTKTKKETLKVHSEQALKAFYEIDKQKHIFSKVAKILKMLNIKDSNGEVHQLSETTLKLINNMFVSAIYLHDIGKANPGMQVKKLENEEVLQLYEGSISGLDTTHSNFSAAIYVDIFYKETFKIKSPYERLFSQICLYAFAYTISSHHGNLKNFEEWAKEENFRNNIKVYTQKEGYSFFLKNKLEVTGTPNAILGFIKDKKISYNGYLFFILIKLLQSSLAVSDFIATSRFFNNNYDEKIDLGLINNIKDVRNVYKDSSIAKSIQLYKGDKENPSIEQINKLRSEMAIEAEGELLKSLDSNIFLLEMPTGSGKTFTSINLGITIMEKINLNKFIYVFPFNTLVDQTKLVLGETLGKAINFEVINSITPVSLNKDGCGNVNYSSTLLDRQMWNYQGIITSHVSLFDILFSGKREASLAFFQLMDTVFILDEIQSYKNDIWTEVIEFLSLFSEVMNSKFIIMSATNPYLYRLIKHPDVNKDKITRLIKDRDKYFLAPEFKNRVIMDKSIRDIKITNEVLIYKIEEAIKKRNELLTQEKSYRRIVASKVLVEFINKKTAQEFEEEIRLKFKDKDYLIFELDGDTPTYERRKIIETIKENATDNIILISTQIIEAGVDIDMDIGFKDISLGDSEEQFMGRINRSSKKPYCVAFFFKLDMEWKIYKKDLRLGKTIMEDKYWNMIENKDFFTYYDEIFSRINNKNNRLNEENIDKFYTDLKLLNVEKIKERMTLIDEQTFQVFIPSKIELEANGKIIEKIDGRELWEDYLKIYNNEDNLLYPKRRIKIKNMMEKMDYFMFNIYGKEIIGEEPVGGIYYLDKKGLLKNGKIDRNFLKESYLIK